MEMHKTTVHTKTQRLEAKCVSKYVSTFWLSYRCRHPLSPAACVRTHEQRLELVYFDCSCNRTVVVGICLVREVAPWFADESRQSSSQRAFVPVAYVSSDV